MVWPLVTRKRTADKWLMANHMLRQTTSEIVNRTQKPRVLSPMLWQRKYPLSVAAWEVAHIRDVPILSSYAPGAICRPRVKNKQVSHKKCTSTYVKVQPYAESQPNIYIYIYITLITNSLPAIVVTLSSVSLVQCRCLAISVLYNSTVHSYVCFLNRCMLVEFMNTVPIAQGAAGWM